MATTVVNLLLKEAFDVYIGGPGMGEDGYFGNFAAPLLYDGTMTREYCLYIYRRYFAFRVKTDPEFRRRLLELRGKRLGCFCAKAGGVTAEDKPWCCHGQVIAAWVDAQPS